jgi:hypothetical protein
MTTIAATNSSATDNLLALLRASSAPSPDAASTAGATGAAPASSTTAKEDGPASFVTLSDQAKAAAAAKAQSDQAAADRLQAYVDAHRVNVTGTGAKTTSSVGGLQNVFFANAAPASTLPADEEAATSGSKVEAIVSQITTLADANEPPPFQPFTPTKNLSSSVTVDGYTLSLDTNAGTQFYGVELSGDGFQQYTDHFGPSAGAGVGSGSLPPGVEISSVIGANNNEAEDAFTITQNVATASSASITSSSGASASASSVSAESSSITFLVNYATGKISVQESAVSVSAQATRTGSPGSTLSTLA